MGWGGVGVRGWDRIYFQRLATDSQIFVVVNFFLTYLTVDG